MLVEAFLLMKWFHIESRLAWADALVHTGLLAGASLLISQNLAYYHPQKGKYLYLLIYATIVSVIWLTFSTCLMRSIFPNKSDYYHWMIDALPVRYIIGWLIITGMGMKSLIWHELGEQRAQMARKDATERMAREAELFKLRQQLQPHFLFNSLNSINALIMLRPQQAREMVLKLSDFLRGSIKREDQQWISLTEELQYLEWYLDIEKVRFGHRLTTEVSSAVEAQAMQMPPMLLQPVVENAIKYGLYDTTEAITITIRAWKEDELLKIEVCNPFDPVLQQPHRGTGFGLSSIRRRLYLLFARNDLLETQAIDNIYTTLIKVPQPNDKSSNH